MDEIHVVILLAIAISLLLGGVIGALNKNTKLEEFIIWELVRYGLIDIFLTASMYRDALKKHVQFDINAEFLKLTIIILPMASMMIIGGICGRALAKRSSEILQKCRKGDEP